MDAVNGAGATTGAGGSGAPGKQRVLLMAGAGRSGSTVLERVIGRLEGVTPLGEARYVWDRGVLSNQRCGCGADFSECPFWGSVGERAFGGWSKDTAEAMLAWRESNDRAKRVPALIREHGQPGRLAGASEYADAYAQIYRAAADISGGQWVTDSSKHVSMPYAVGLSDRLDVRVVQLVRDPRGVAFSWQRSVVRPEITERVELMPQYSSTQVAKTWVIHNAALAPLGRLGIPLLRVRYEDFVADPLDCVTSIARFMDVSVPAALEAELRGGYVELGVDHSVAGNPMRFKTGALSLDRDSEWESALPARDQRLIAGLTSPLLLRYGYPFSVAR